MHHWRVLVLRMERSIIKDSSYPSVLLAIALDLCKCSTAPCHRQLVQRKGCSHENGTTSYSHGTATASTVFVFGSQTPGVPLNPPTCTPCRCSSNNLSGLHCSGRWCGICLQQVSPPISCTGPWLSLAAGPLQPPTQHHHWGSWLGGSNCQASSNNSSSSSSSMSCAHYWTCSTTEEMSRYVCQQVCTQSMQAMIQVEQQR